MASHELKEADGTVIHPKSSVIRKMNYDLFIKNESLSYPQMLVLQSLCSKTQDPCVIPNTQRPLAYLDVLFPWEELLSETETMC